MGPAAALGRRGRRYDSAAAAGCRPLLPPPCGSSRAPRRRSRPARLLTDAIPRLLLLVAGFSCRRFAAQRARPAAAIGWRGWRYDPAAAAGCAACGRAHTCADGGLVAARASPSQAGEGARVAMAGPPRLFSLLTTDLSVPLVLARIVRSGWGWGGGAREAPSLFTQPVRQPNDQARSGRAHEATPIGAASVDGVRGLRTGVRSPYPAACAPPPIDRGLCAQRGWSRAIKTDYRLESTTELSGAPVGPRTRYASLPALSPTVRPSVGRAKRTCPMGGRRAGA